MRGCIVWSHQLIRFDYDSIVTQGPPNVSPAKLLPIYSEWGRAPPSAVLMWESQHLSHRHMSLRSWRWYLCSRKNETQIVGFITFVCWLTAEQTLIDSIWTFHITPITFKKFWKFSVNKDKFYLKVFLIIVMLIDYLLKQLQTKSPYCNK